MSNNLSMNLLREQKAYACADANCGPAEGFASGQEHLARQTGQALIALGHMFVNIPAFNSHIDRSTGEMLISLGRKLSKRK